MGAGTVNSPTSEKPRYFFCCGQHGSGSTWMFNLVREICRTQGVEFVSCHQEAEANLPLYGLGTRLLVVKSHNPMADLRSLIANSGDPAVITVRDPRDAVVSLMQRFPNGSGKTFDEALKTVAHSAQSLVALAALRELPVFRYEAQFIDSTETFDSIAALLGTTPSEDQRRAILAGLSAASVKQTISELEKVGVIKGEDAWDRETHWHANHVGDRKIGKFESVLSFGQSQAVLEQTRAFCERFDYDVAVGESGETTTASVGPGDAAHIASVDAGQPALHPGKATAERETCVRMKTIALCMIVKNEAPVIRRCLDSVRAIIDYWVVVDTGSSDGTQDIIRDHLQDLPGELHERPWRDFAYNRSEALTLARPHGDYSLIIDADDILEVPDGFQLPSLTDDSYEVGIVDTSIEYQRTQLVSNRKGWRYEGVLHEFLTCENAETKGLLTGIRMHRNHDGARRRDPTTYHRDAEVLERALATETDPFLISRYTFYLAQSYRDSGEMQRALKHYLARSELGFWQEEVFVALLQAARIKEALGHSEPEVIDAFVTAGSALSTRAEAWHSASRYSRVKNRFQEGYEFARHGLAITRPKDGLFVETWIYEYGLLDELSVNGYWSGHYQECLAACERLLRDGKMPTDMQDRVKKNAEFAAGKLESQDDERASISQTSGDAVTVNFGSRPNLGTFGAEDFKQQHVLKPQRWLHSRLKDYPRVMLAIFVKDDPPALQFYLECIDALDYPKSSLVIYVCTNKTLQNAAEILREWLARVGPFYRSVEFESSDFKVFGRIRNQSTRRALDLECEFYFVADADNFIRPQTLRELVALDLPIAAPFLRATAPGQYYSNYHAEIDENGYYKECDQYIWLLERRVRGVVEVPVVNGTYLVRADVIPELSYQDASKRNDYVIFSDNARKAGIPQYLDNRQVYGYVGDGDGDGDGDAGHDMATIRNSLRVARTTKRRVVWHRPGAVGDVLMTLNLVRLYKEKNPDDWLIYKAAPWIVNLLRPVMVEAGVDEVVTTAEQVECDKRVDLIGYPFHEGHPEVPMARHILEYFSEELGLGGQYEELKLKLPKPIIESPYITLHATSSWSMYKNWPLDRWAWICQELKQRGIRVVQIGGPEEPAIDGVELSSLGSTFTESLGLLANAVLHVGVDSWSNHATNIVWEGKGKVPGIILWGSTQASTLGYPQNHNISLGLPCQPCFREDPKISRLPRGVCPNPPEQSYDKPLHACMHGISRERVFDVIIRQYTQGLGRREPAKSPSTLATAASSGTENGSAAPHLHNANLTTPTGEVPQSFGSTRMRHESKLIEEIIWKPVHGASARTDDDGLLILRDGKALDWHLLRWTDPRLNGCRVKLTLVAKPAQTCESNLYVHHWGGADLCSIDKDGMVVLDDGVEEIQVERHVNGFFTAIIVFENRHPTISFGTGKPCGRYHGSGMDQYFFKKIEVEILARNEARKVIVDRLWNGRDPFHGLPGNLFEYDLQGWNSQHLYLSEAITALHSDVVVEIGVWKGGSTVFMANEIKRQRLSAIVIAVDTWLGSSEHWTGPSNIDLSVLNGHPALYYKFLSNVIRADVADYVVPLPIDSLNAAQVLLSLDIRPGMIHLDGGHDYESVMADLRVWWPTLAPGGIFVGDDYFTNGTWPGVRKAFDDYFGLLNLTPIENVEGKCRVRKPK